MENITGQRFGRLTAVKFVSKERNYYWEFVCDCGTVKAIAKRHVKSGSTKSCGCLEHESRQRGNNTRHSFAKGKIEPFYHVWANMLQRTTNPSNKGWKDYGGRGVGVCQSWINDFRNFRDDMHKSYLEHIERFGQTNTTIDRVDNNGDYCLKNCKWATRKEQANNRRMRERVVV